MIDIHQGEIWKKTECLYNEGITNFAIGEKLQAIGFLRNQEKNYFYTDTLKANVCLVDDFQCLNLTSTRLPTLFDKHHVIITDNYVNCPTRYQILRTPESFYGIYHYLPTLSNWTPQRDFAFCINRVDQSRILLLLELAWSIGIDKGFVNFNCNYRFPDRTDAIINNCGVAFWTEWNKNDSVIKHLYQKVCDSLSKDLPIKNYDFEFEAVQSMAWLNIVVETYSSDYVISLSEKIFRALVTPAPWAVYSGKHTITYLENLGFDCMSDIVDHSRYDTLNLVENKPQAFILHCINLIKDIKNLPFDLVNQRCIDAASNNCAVLENMKNRFPGDFCQWLDKLADNIAGLNA